MARLARARHFRAMETRLSPLLGAAIGARADTPEAEAALVERLRGFAEVLDIPIGELRDAVGAGAETARSQGEGIRIAAARDGAPDWVQLMPAGQIVARDGRRWRLSDPAAVVAAFASNGADLPVDLEHATQIKGAAGEAAPAVGWIRAMEVRDGAIFARVDWTEAGREAVASRAYRYISPAFASSKSTGEITAIFSAGLTNTPALRLAALSRKKEDDDMDLSRFALAAGLPATAGEAEIEAAIAALRRHDTTDLARFAPRADLDQALARAGTAEAEIARIREEAATAAIDAALDAAIEAGKIAPASREFYVHACRAEGGLAKFEAMIASAPAIVAPADRPKKAPQSSDGLTPEDIATCAAMGIDRAEFARARAEETR